MKPRPACVLPVLPAIVLVAIAIVLLACGGSNRSLQSVSVSPTAATSPAQFTATGIYRQMPTSVDITSTTTWCIGSTSGLCSADVVAFAEVTAGLAECESGFSGTVTVLAGQAGPTPGVNQQAQLQPFGSAQLTCP
ncbi:MAG: hypothetical protein WAM04_02945 [Candidatus Sulfotelmatobacter sp.]